jgi:hypothetical protein
MNRQQDDVLEASDRRRVREWQAEEASKDHGWLKQ